MIKRSFEKSRWFLMACVIALTMVLICGGVRLAMAGPESVPEERPMAALYAVSWNTAAITETTTTTGYLTQNYAYQDVACDMDFYSDQTITITLEASPDNSIWFQTHSFTAITTDTTVTTGIFSRTVSYARYERMVLTAETSATVTPTCKSVFFNNWMPGGNAEPME